MKHPIHVPIQPVFHIQGCGCSACEPIAPSVQTFGQAIAATCLSIAVGASVATTAVLAWNGVGPVWRAVTGQ